MKKLLLSCALLPILGACASGGGTYVPPKDVSTRLTLVGKGTALPPGLTAEQAKDEAAVQKECGGPPPASAMAFSPFDWLIDRGLSYLVDAVDHRLQNELKTYTATFSAEKQITNFYSEIPTLTYPCFQVTARYKKDPKDETEQVAMDFIGKMTNDDNVLKVTPLRLYYAASQAKTDGSQIVGVSIGLKMDNHWREVNRGESRMGVFDQSILAEKVDFKAGHFYRSYLKADAVDATRTKIGALPAVTVKKGGELGGNFLVATVTVAEVGKVPWLLEKGAGLFNDKKDDVKAKLKEAVDKIAKPEGASQ